LGEIVAIDDQTENVLFIVDRDGEELLIPAADDLILEIDDEAQTIRMDLPAGLVNPAEAEVGD
jgi:16S rRNA processing protein RimM